MLPDPATAPATRRKDKSRKLKGARRVKGAKRRAAGLGPRLQKLLDLRRKGRVREALAAAREALADHPDEAGVNLVIGILLNDLGDWGVAYAHLKKAATLSPENPAAWFNLGHCLFFLNEFEAAVIACRQAARLRPGDHRLHALLGQALANAGQSAEAIACYRRALEIRPDFHEGHYLIGVEHTVRGEFADARDAFLRVVESAPDAFKAYQGLARLKLEPDERGEVVAQLERTLSRKDLNKDQRAALCFALGRLRDQNGDYEGAFEAYASGNEIEKAALPFERDAFAGQIEATIAAFRPELFEARTQAASPTALPVFIVGMPRSGTTLVEQIVSSHPRVHAGGENPRMQIIVAALLQARSGPLQYPRDIADIDAAALAALGEQYLAELEKGAPEHVARITDKLPSNFMNLGLIRLLFPNAAIIHCRREPMDTCLSCYFQHFTRVGRQNFANDLEDLGFYYTQYLRLMDHWRRVLPAPPLELVYEELVGDQEAVSRRLIAHVGLDWDPACLEFHANERGVRTASLTQVRQPVYTSSMQRWRHYERHLDPLKRALASPGN